MEQFYSVKIQKTTRIIYFGIAITFIFYQTGKIVGDMLYYINHN